MKTVIYVAIVLLALGAAALPANASEDSVECSLVVQSGCTHTHVSGSGSTTFQCALYTDGTHHPGAEGCIHSPDACVGCPKVRPVFRINR